MAGDRRRRPIRRTGRLAAAIGCLGLAAACARGPQADVAAGRGSDFAEGRRTLLLAAASGPVPLLLERPPAVLGGPAEVARIAQAATSDVARVSFVPRTDEGAAPERVRLVMRFADLEPDSPSALCSGEPPDPAAPAQVPPRLQAALCDGPRAVGDAVGIARGADREQVASLVRETTQAVVPPSPGRASGGYYGFPGVSVFGGVGGDSGGIGIGVGGIGLGF